MSKEDREKAILLEQRRIEIAQKAKLEREKVERMKKLAEYDRQEKAGEKVDASVGNKLAFGANIVTFKPPVSKGGWGWARLQVLRAQANQTFFGSVQA